MVLWLPSQGSAHPKFSQIENLGCTGENSIENNMSIKILNNRLYSSSRALAFLFAPLFCVLFYAHCSIKIEPCDGDPSADPEFDCLPYAPELSEPESDGAGNYKIPIKGVDALDKYEYQEACFTTYMEAEAVNWEGRAVQASPASESHLSVSPDSVTEPLCFYRARACNQFGCGRWTEPVKIVSGLTAPGDLRVDGITPNAAGIYTLNTLTYSIAWDPVGPDIALDRYEYREDDGLKQNVGSSLSSPSITKTSYGVSYSYQVRTCGSVVGKDLGEDCSAWSPPAIAELRLPVPLNLRSDAPSLGSYDRVYTISWDSVTAAVGYDYGYHLQESGGGGSAWTDIGDGTSLSYVSEGENAGSVGGISYSYRVRACTDSNNMGDLAEDDIKCSSWFDPPVSVDVFSLSDASALSLDGGGSVSHSPSFTVRWSSVEGAGVYILTESVEEGDDVLHEIDAADTSLGFNGKEYGETYTYTLKACAGDGSADDFTCVDQGGAPPAALSVEVKPGTPADLKDDDFQQSTDGKYELTWDAAAAGAGAYYELQESSKALDAADFADWPKLSDGGEKLLASSLNSTRYPVTKTGANFEKYYQYQVRACAANNFCGDWSDASAAVRLKFGKPVLESIVADGAGSYTLDWDSVAEANRYVIEEIQYDTTESRWPANWKSAAVSEEDTEDDHGVSGKRSGDKFRYHVKACFDTVCGDYSVVSNDVEVPTFPGDPDLSVSDRAEGDEQDNSYNITWSSVEDAERYEFKEWEEGETEPSVYEDLGDAVSLWSGTKFSKEYLAQEYQKIYHYKVRACADNNCTLESAATVNVNLAKPSLTLSGADSPETDGKYTLDLGQRSQC